MPRDRTTIALGLGALGALIWWLMQPRSSSTAAGSSNLITQGVDAVTAALAGWKNAGQGPQWVPILNAAEQQYGIPTDLLARIAYQESHFRQDIIEGSTVSSAGALGLMQLEPQFFSSVNVPRPFTAEETNAQIQEAAKAVVSDFEQLGDWQLTVAAYDSGLGAVKKYQGVPPFPETERYVAQVTADVPSIVSA